MQAGYSSSMRPSRDASPVQGRSLRIPCYWIYWEVGETLLEHGSPNALHKKWIETYGSEEFGALVEAVLDLTYKTCEDLNANQKAHVTRALVTTGR